MQVSKPLSGAGSALPERSKTMPRVLLETALGDIELELDAVAAPVTSANFLRYLDSGAYDSGQFYRTVTPDNQPSNPIRIGVIQGSRRKGTPAYPPIALERTSITGLRHLDGTLSMARTGPDTATDEFFLCIGDQPELDYGGGRNPDGQGFAAFGRVLRGWLVLRKIQSAPRKDQSLDPPISIVRARRL